MSFWGQRIRGTRACLPLNYRGVARIFGQRGGRKNPGGAKKFPDHNILNLSPPTLHPTPVDNFFPDITIAFIAFFPISVTFSDASPQI